MTTGSDMAHGSGPAGGAARVTARALGELLTARGRYRELWERRAKRRRGSALNQAAVAAVLARHLAESSTGVNPPPDLVQVVRRALRGDVLTAETLALFIGAFRLSAADARMLLRLRRGEQLPPRGGPVRSAPSVTHQTVVLHELHEVGENGIPVRHRTIQVLRALAPGLSSYTYTFDTTAVGVRVLRGADCGPVYPTEQGLFSVDLTFARPLRQGETASLEYETDFRYDSPPPSEFRRATRGRIERMEIRVQFHPRRLPRTVAWTLWSDPTPHARVLAQELVSLDADSSVHRFVGGGDAATVGFAWTWPSHEDGAHART